MFTEAFFKRVLMFIGVILSGLITLIFVATPEQFDVPVPDSFTPITTKSARLQQLTIAEKFFGKPVTDTISGATISSVVSWSPNSKYLLTNIKLATTEETKTQPYVLDLSRRLYVPVPDAKWIDTATWSGSKLLYQTEKGYAVFDVATGEMYAFGRAELSSRPLFSPDGTKVVYADRGLVFYNLVTQKNVRLSSDEGDMPMLWYAEGRKFLFKKETGTGAGKKFTAHQYDFDKKSSTLLTDLDKPFKQASWLARDEVALMTLGTDDGNFEYIYNVITGEKKFITETSEGRAFINSHNETFIVVEDKIATLYSKTLEILKKNNLTIKGNIRGATLLARERLVVVHGPTYDASTVTLLDLEDKTETKLADIWLPYVFASPEGNSLVTVASGNVAAQFIAVPRGE